MPVAGAPSFPPAALLVAILMAPAAVAGDPSGPQEVLEVRPGDSIQQALDRAATDPAIHRVRVLPGTYRPLRAAQALVVFDARHDGLILEADGEVILTAASPDRADPGAVSYPALVNHVVYFGHGIGPGTVLRGFRITGGNNFFADAPRDLPAIEPALGSIPALKEHTFFYSDGGGIKIFGRSYPTLENLEVVDNFASPCGGGVSVEHRGFREGTVVMRNCIFRGNRAAETGSAVDILPYSSATIDNCLFVGNVANLGYGAAGGTAPGTSSNYNAAHGSGALTVFPGSTVTVLRSTFTGNWNGVDDKGLGSRYRDSIFWDNSLAGGLAPGRRYEIDILDARNVEGCFFGGTAADLRGTVDPARNILGAEDPRFDELYRPRSPAYREVGYRPGPGSAATRAHPGEGGKGSGP